MKHSIIIPCFNEEDTLAVTLADLEKQHILATLAQCKGNRTRTAEVLDINIRTLRNKLKEYKEAGESAD